MHANKNETDFMKYFLAFLILIFITGINTDSYAIGDKDKNSTDKTRTGSTLKIKKQNLYIIQRSKNRNTVFYDLNIMPNGDVFSYNPIDCYWKMYEKYGVREELTAFEKLTAYGYDIQKNQKGDYFIQMNSLKNRAIQLVREKSGAYSCVTYIAGKKSNLKKIYVFTDESHLITTVKYIELFGKELASGADTYERIMND